MSETLPQAEIKRGPRGRFLPGQAPKSPGRPVGTYDYVTELITAMRKVEKKKRKPIFEHAWDMAYDEPKLMASLFRKILPDLQHQTGEVRPVSISIHYGHAAVSPAPRITVTQPLPGHGHDA